MFLFLQVVTPNEFGNSWMTTPDRCYNETMEPNPCEGKREAKEQAEDLCYIIINNFGETALTLRKSYKSNKCINLLLQVFCSGLFSMV